MRPAVNGRVVEPMRGHVISPVWTQTLSFLLINKAPAITSIVRFPLLQQRAISPLGFSKDRNECTPPHRTRLADRGIERNQAAFDRGEQQHGRRITCLYCKSERVKKLTFRSEASCQSRRTNSRMRRDKEIGEEGQREEQQPSLSCRRDRLRMFHRITNVLSILLNRMRGESIQFKVDDAAVTYLNLRLPTEIPSLSDQSPIRTNTSLTVFWTPATVCSSHLTGYNYQLIKESDSLTILDSGFTTDTSASFQNLTASTNYIVKVYVVTIAGWNTMAYLSINASTSATVPEAVRNLTVYKRGRNMLGLRWAAPKSTYGTLKSFMVAHSLGKETISHSVEPTPCVVWPNLFCYTITGLRPNRKYNITVSARNVDVADDGAKAFVNGLTREMSPTSPENLTLVNSTSTSVGLRWSHPNLANGIIRSFVVSVEETDKFDQDSCCQVYPLVETPVMEEKDTYDVEVSGLHPASTYVVSVSAKTIGLGPSQSVTVVTRPPHLAITVLTPDFPDDSDLKLELDRGLWLPQEKRPELNNSDVYSSLIAAHLLLIVPSDLQAPMNDSCIKEPKLDSLLRSEIGDQFWFYKEYDEESYMDESDWGYSVDCVSLQDGQNHGAEFHSRVTKTRVVAFKGQEGIAQQFVGTARESSAMILQEMTKTWKISHHGWLIWARSRQKAE
ncbi:hypothetical protein J6590_043926 [Homalodisca vitripennis]|nr:hypothetical protein J6590_043926 [Homalodisca vitripennis]